MSVYQLRSEDVLCRHPKPATHGNRMDTPSRSVHAASQSACHTAAHTTDPESSSTFTGARCSSLVQFASGLQGVRLCLAPPTVKPADAACAACTSRMPLNGEDDLQLLTQSPPKGSAQVVKRAAVETRADQAWDTPAGPATVAAAGHQLGLWLAALSLVSAAGQLASGHSGARHDKLTGSQAPASRGNHPAGRP